MTRAERTKYLLTTSDDGYAWDRATYEVRMDLCQDLAKQLDRFPGRRDAKWYYDLLYTTFSGNPNKSTTIQDVVQLGVTIHASQ